MPRQGLKTALIPVFFRHFFSYGFNRTVALSVSMQAKEVKCDDIAFENLELFL